jgi:transcriptional regulator with XRE-family HTH domain
MQFLKELRKVMKLSKYRMASLLGISTSHYTHLEERSTRLPDIRILLKIQEIAGLADDEFWALLKESFNEGDSDVD